MVRLVNLDKSYSGSAPYDTPIMTNQAYIEAYQKLTSEYDNNQLSMEEYLEAVRKLKEQYLKGRTGIALPPVP